MNKIMRLLKRQCRGLKKEKIETYVGSFLLYLLLVFIMIPHLIYPASYALMFLFIVSLTFQAIYWMYFITRIIKKGIVWLTDKVYDGVTK